LREQGTVVDLGFYQQGTNEVFLGKEFHHNRLRHICAQIGDVPRHQKPGWDKLRLAKETVAFLSDNEKVFADELISHIFPFSQAQEAFDRLSQRDPEMFQVLLTP
jgi:threonine dehydrogenase-like Zn-dependent dehydrogenase